MHIKPLLVGVFLLMAPGILFGQAYGFQQYTVADGLASNETYYCLQASDGYVYVSSDRGLQRFNGDRFISVPFSKSELNGSTVFSMQEDQQKLLWVSSYREGLFCVRRDTLQPHPLNKQIKSILRNSFIDQFFFNKHGELYFSVQGQLGQIYAIRRGKLDTIKPEGASNYQNFYGAQKQVYLNGGKGIAKGGVYTLRPGQQSQEPHIITAITRQQPASALSYPKGGPVLVSQGKVYVAAVNNLLVYSLSGVFVKEHVFDSQILSIFEEEGNLLVGCVKGFYRLRRGKAREHLLQNYLINDISKDKEGGYWFATTTKGLFYLPSFSIKVLLSGHRIASLSANEHKLVVTDYEPRLHLFEIREGAPEREASFPISAAFRDVRLTPDMLMFSGGTVQFSERQQRLVENKAMAARSYLPLGDTASLLAISTGAYIQHFNKPDALVYPLIKDVYFFCNTLAASAQCFYLGTDEGVMLYNRKTGEHKRLLSPLIKSLINDLEVINDSILIVATKNNGLFVLNHHQLKAHFTTANSDLSSMHCNRVVLQGDTLCWVGTDAGINRLTLVKQNDKHAWHISKAEGAYAQKINALAVSGNSLFFGTDEACYYLNTTEVIQKVKAIPVNILVAGKHFVQKAQDTLWLKQGVRSFPIRCEALSFRYKNQLEFRYQLDDDMPVSTQSADFYINGLSPGVHRLQVNVAGPSGNWNKAPTDIFLIVPAFYYEKANYQILGVVLAFILLVLVIYGVVSYRYTKEKRKWKLRNLQLQALNLQLNPHFIFNALSNIQHLALKGSQDEIKTFIRSFTRLTRKVLDNSKFKVISLAEELENTADFVKLEHLRFKDYPFHFDLTVSKDLATETLFVPPMILQPCVENAIWHGLLPKDGNRCLTIEVRTTSRGFCIAIKDNGVGLCAANLRQSEGSQTSGVGLINTKLRLELYHEMKMGSCTFHVEEVFHAHGESAGTLASFDFKPNHKRWTLH
jgi:hypothetical protein